MTNSKHLLNYIKPIKVIRVLYVTNSLNAYSETFIRNTIDSLYKCPDVEIKLAITKSKQSTVQGTINLQIPKCFQYLFYVFAKCGFEQLSGFLKYILVKNKLSKEDYDVTWIDFGDNGVYLFPIFNMLGKKMFLHLHGYDASKLLLNNEYRKKIVDLSKNNKIVVPSQYNRKRLILSGCHENNIHVLPYAFYNEYRNIVEINYRSKNPILLFVGRFVPKKDPRILVYVFREVVKVHNNAELVMIGDGELLGDVIALVNEFKLGKRVRILGSQTHQNVLGWMRSATIYIQHSVTSANGDQEGYPNAILEAQCSGLPVVSTIHAGIPEIVVDGETGYLVQEFDFEKMAERISFLLSDQNLVSKMSLKAIELFENSALPEKRVQKIVQLINSGI